jgi:hypothetical protein
MPTPKTQARIDANLCARCGRPRTGDRPTAHSPAPKTAKAPTSPRGPRPPVPEGDFIGHSRRFQPAETRRPALDGPSRTTIRRIANEGYGGNQSAALRSLLCGALPKPMATAGKRLPYRRHDPQ